MILTINYKGFSFDVRGTYDAGEEETNVKESFEIDKLLFKGVDFTELILTVIDPSEIELLCIEEIDKI